MEREITVRLSALLKKWQQLGAKEKHEKKLRESGALPPRDELPYGPKRQRL